MRIQNLSSVVIVTLLAITCDAKSRDSNQPTIKRSFTLTPGYMERTFNSNETMKHGPLCFMQLTSKGMDALMDLSDNPWVKGGVFAAFAFPHYLVSETSSTVYHEFGHARAMASNGTPYRYSAAIKENLFTDYAYGIFAQKILNPSALFDGAYTQSMGQDNYTKLPKPFLKRVIGSAPKQLSKTLNTWWKSPAGVDETNLSPIEKWILSKFKNYHDIPTLASAPIVSDYTSEEEVQAVVDKLHSGTILSAKENLIRNLIESEFDLPMITAGLNNEMRFAQEISEIIFKHKGHQTYFTPYFIGKFSSCSYVLWHESQLAAGKVSWGNDIANILLSYKNRDYSIDASDIKIGSLASLFLSSTTWSFAYSAITEVPKGSFLVRPPVWHGWRLPDLNFYMTSQGLSFEVVTGYQFNENWYTGLTAEMVYKGNTAYEFGPSIGYKFNTPSGEFEVSAQAIIENDMEFGGNAGIEWTSPCKDWTVGVKYIYHNALTLVGERNIPFLCSGFMSGGDPSATNHEANITVSYNY